MLKKLDQYIIKTFFWAVSIYFQRAVFHLYGKYCMDSAFAVYRKRLEQLGNCKILFYLSVNVVKMVLPLTILFGFHYDF